LNIISGPHSDDAYSDEIECARCGERFYYELLECPNCGARVYSSFEEEEDELQGVEPGSEGVEGGFMEFIAILSGWFVAALIVLALFLPLRNAFSIQPESGPEQILLVLTSALGGFTAAWLTVRLVGARWMLHGLLAGLGGLGAAIGLYWILYGSPQVLLSWMGIWFAIPLVVLVSLGGAALADRMLKAVQPDSLFGRALQEREIYQRLLAIARNDKAVVERLITYEKQKLPRASRLELMQRAVERWERDNR
jgi:hypothetical protein